MFVLERGFPRARRRPPEASARAARKRNPGVCPPVRTPRLPAFAAVIPTLALALLAGSASGTVLFPSFPDWESDPQGQYGTGCALRDLNGDGWPDLVIANGNDMARQRLAVYLNSGGSFPSLPTWTSTDIDYHGHLDLADVDGDGFLDCAVAVYIGAGGFSQPGRVKLYRGNGDGTFSASPVWSCATPFYCFSVAFGDANEDGRPDLACAAGEPYNRYKERVRVFRNVGGSLETAPYWQSSATKLSLDVTWGDINGDGHLDLVIAGSAKATGSDPIPYRNEVYYGDGATFPGTPSWESQDARFLANTIATGDLNGDGWLDLAVADNYQEGGAGDGRTKVYLNDGAGQLAGTPAWTSSFDGYGSHVSFADVDRDGDFDLAAGSWWGKVRIYENSGGAIPAAPTWQSGSTSVIENIAWEDVDNDAPAAPTLTLRTGDGTRHLFDTGFRPVRFLEVRVAGAVVPPEEFFGCTEQGWLVLANAPSAGAEVRVKTSVAAAPDFAVSNWDASIGDYLFLNGFVPTAAPVEAPLAASLSISPNPSPGSARVVWRGRSGGEVIAEVFGPDGARVRAGRLQGDAWLWDGRDDSGARVPAGTYWIRVRGGARVERQRVVVLR